MYCHNQVNSKDKGQRNMMCYGIHWNVEIHTKAKELDEKLSVSLMKMKNELLMNKFWFHVPNTKVDAEIQNELVLFEG